MLDALLIRMVVGLAVLTKRSVDDEPSPADLEGRRKNSGLPRDKSMPEISPEMKRMFRKFKLSTSLIDKQETGKLTDRDDRPMDAYLDVFYDVCRSPVDDPHRFELLHRCIDRSMKEGRDGDDDSRGGSFEGSIEDTIDVVLDYALEHTFQPFDTAILALVRYRIEQQRKQVVNA